MRRLTILLLAVLGVGLLPTFPASARGDGWEFLPSGEITTPACGTVIQETIAANKEYAKFAVDGDGVLHFVLVTGVFKVKVTNIETGSSIVVNASGTGHDALLYPNGDFVFTSAGPSLIVQSEEQAAETGLPTLFLNSGNMVIVFKGDGSAELRLRTGRLTDLCPLIT